MTVETDIVALRARVRELEGHLKYLYSHLNIIYFENTQAGDAKVVEMIKMGNKIEAIKIYRELHNVELLEARLG